jgi:hypothetical protein
VREGASRTPHVSVVEESDWAVVPAKGPNKGGRPSAEDLEGRAWTKENVRRVLHSPHTVAGRCDTETGGRAEGMSRCGVLAVIIRGRSRMS